MTDKYCRICRREGKKLFLKGERCLSSKCSFSKRSYGPGSHGADRKSKPSDYAVQLREKQRAKVIYGLREQQFKNYYQKAAKSKSATGEEILQKLECRLDNVVYRLGLAYSRNQARQMISHGHILVNGKKNSIASYQTRKKDLIESTMKNIRVKSVELPIWLSIDKKKLAGEIIKIPDRQEIKTDVNEQLIVEYYSR